MVDVLPMIDEWRTRGERVAIDGVRGGVARASDPVVGIHEALENGERFHRRVVLQLGDSGRLNFGRLNLLLLDGVQQSICSGGDRQKLFDNLTAY